MTDGGSGRKEQEGSSFKEQVQAVPSTNARSKVISAAADSVV